MKIAKIKIPRFVLSLSLPHISHLVRDSYSYNHFCFFFPFLYLFIAKFYYFFFRKKSLLWRQKQCKTSWEVMLWLQILDRWRILDWHGTRPYESDGNAPLKNFNSSIDESLAWYLIWIFCLCLRNLNKLKCYLNYPFKCP